ncbi:phage tail protein [Aeromonas hydrophila]|uniref:phage tail protein n=1 Tax=Aeromonas hydrophila TaxID=644 RepID=UPI0002F57F22|nr:phage tail protein [Aeromonas hydrophila]
MSAIYFAIPTDAGQAKLANAIALGVPLKITHMAVGDGNGQPVTPNAAQTALVRERRRAPINTLFQDPTNQSQLVAEQIIPENVGDWWIREAGIFSEDGTLIAIANTPDTYKPLLSSGAGRTQVIRIVLIVSDTSAVELKIDPAVVLATRKYVDDLLAAHKQSREHPDASETAKGFTRYATQAEVNETVTANQKTDAVVTVKTLWGWVKQASETVLGMIKVASQAQTDAGTADDVAITPKKLRSGISFMLGSVGYICLPTWMGGIIIQWGLGIGASTYDFSISFPVAFPTACWAATVSCDYTEGTGRIGYVACKKERTRLVCRSSDTLSTNWIAIGI